MSHFTVLIIGDNPEKQLAPFQENNMGDCPKSFLKFNNVEPEYRKKYNSEKTPMVKFPDGTLESKYNDKFYQAKSEGGWSQREFVLPKGAKLVSIPVKKKYKTFKEYIESYGGYEKDPIKKKYGYWENPNKKWDWYQLGGRWTGYFKLKEGAPISTGEGSLVYGNSAKEGYGDIARIEEIDFEAMRNGAEKEARDLYALVEKTCGGKIPKLEMTWNQAMKEKRYSKLTLDEKRTLYHGQEGLLAFKRGKEKLPKEESEKLFWLDLESFQVPLETYAAQARAGAVSTFAVLKDGKWYERGEMGWWGNVFNEKDQRKWDKEFHKLIDSLSPKTIVSVYDCHI